MLDTTRETLSGLSNLLDSSMDGPPVIRPVLDLSNVTSGARSIGGLFAGRQTVAVNTMQTKSLANSVRMDSAASKINQNGTEVSSQQASGSASLFDFSNSQFSFSDKLDFRAWKLELDNLARDAERAKGSVY